MSEKLGSGYPSSPLAGESGAAAADPPPAPAIRGNSPPPGDPAPPKELLIKSEKVGDLFRLDGWVMSRERTEGMRCGRLHESWEPR